MMRMSEAKTCYCVVVNENMHDADCWVETHTGDGLPKVGPWERVFSAHDTLEEANAALVEVKEYVRGKRK
jgi:hypothetical protein